MSGEAWSALVAITAVISAVASTWLSLRAEDRRRLRDRTWQIEDRRAAVAETKAGMLIGEVAEHERQVWHAVMQAFTARPDDEGNGVARQEMARTFERAMILCEGDSQLANLLLKKQSLGLEAYRLAHQKVHWLEGRGPGEQEDEIQQEIRAALDKAVAEADGADFAEIWQLVADRGLGHHLPPR